MIYPEKYRMEGDFGSAGAFVVPVNSKIKLCVIAAVGFQWEHVSVSLIARPPVWREMCIIKDLFWATDETVVQYHPPKSKNVNIHPNCLHLWRICGVDFPLPPIFLV